MSCQPGRRRVVVDVHAEHRAEVLASEQLVGRVGALGDGRPHEVPDAVVGLAAGEHGDAVGWSAAGRARRRAGRRRAGRSPPPPKLREVGRRRRRSATRSSRPGRRAPRRPTATAARRRARPPSTSGPGTRTRRAPARSRARRRIGRRMRDDEVLAAGLADQARVGRVAVDRLADRRHRCWNVAVDPVKWTPASAGCGSATELTAAPSPVTMLITPGGRPAASNSRIV